MSTPTASLAPTAPSGSPAPRSHGRRAAAATALALVLVGAGGGAVALAASSAPPEGAAVVQQWLLDLGADSSSMPEGYTVEQYEAFWGAGYTSEDRQVLQDLWHTDATETKARAGQMLIDGERVPVAPSDPGLTGLEQLPSGS